MKTNCLIVEDEPLARKLLQSHIAKVETLCLVAECGSALEAMTALQRHRVDLVFLDIRMPEFDGLQLIRTLPHPPAVIFTTAYREFGADAFDLNALDYLLKPIAFDRFLKAVNKYFDRRAAVPIEPDPEAGWFFVTSERRKVRIAIDQVMLVESLDDYVKIHLADKVISTRDNITMIGNQLPPDAFVRIHRSFIAPVARVQSISGEGVEVANRFLPFGRAYKQLALARLGISKK
jgi:DNA-binding LytR/AlgR family response regulator